MDSVGTESLPLFATAQTLGQEGIERARRAHPAEFQRCVGIAKELAKKDTGRGVTVEDVRRAAGLLTSTGRDLAWLGGVLRAAGLQPTKEYRRSELPCTHGNLNRVYRPGRAGE